MQPPKKYSLLKILRHEHVCFQTDKTDEVAALFSHHNAATQMHTYLNPVVSLNSMLIRDLNLSRLK